MSDSKRPRRPEPNRSESGCIRSRTQICGLWLWCGLLALSGGAFAGPETATSDPAAMGGAQPDQVSPWLDEVRAQREAWEARRSAVREQHEQRRRAHHPRSAVQPDAWEADLRRRRAERQERIEQDRAVFRRLAPGAWGLPWSVTEDGAWGAEWAPPPSPQPSPISPPGWDNLWYFRGY